jgi:cytochrome c553
MPKGDITRGKAAHDGLYCDSCHGAEGIAPSRNYPHLAGQRAEYTWKVLRDYKAFRRDEGDGRHQTMVRLGQLLTEQQIADLAAYYASLPLPEGKGEVTRRTPHGKQGRSHPPAHRLCLVPRRERPGRHERNPGAGRPGEGLLHPPLCQDSCRLY